MIPQTSNISTFATSAISIGAAARKLAATVTTTATHPN